MHEHALEGTLTRGADGVLYLLSPGTCVRVQDTQSDLPDGQPEAIEVADSRGDGITDRLSAADDHAAARMHIEAGDHRSARIMVDPGDHEASRIMIEADDNRSARIMVDPGDHGGSRIMVDPGESLVN